jgi:hypothetical protein
MANGLYGNMMTYFQGQFVDMINFDMLPNINSGFDTTKTRDGQPVTPLPFRGCFHDMQGDEAKDANGNLVITACGDLWSDTSLSLGTFIQIVGTKPVYRIKEEKAWENQGGFFWYHVEQVLGDDGTLTVEPEFNLGEGNFA